MSRTQSIRFLVLANLGDDTALQVAALLGKRHGHSCVRLVSSEELVMAPRWTHCLEGCAANSEVELADGTRLSASGIEVVFNRLRGISMPHFANAKKTDREYALMEMHALLMSWLYSLPCPVFNPATGRGLAGAERSFNEWLTLAGSAGFPVRASCFASDPRRFKVEAMEPHWAAFGTDVPEPGPPLLSPAREPVCYLQPVVGETIEVLVAGEYLSTEVPYKTASRLRKLRECSGCDLLQVEFALTAGGEWMVVKATGFPQARTCADVAAIVRLMDTPIGLPV